MSSKAVIAVVVIAVIGIGAAAFFFMGGGIGPGNNSVTPQIDDDDQLSPVIPSKVYKVDHLKSGLQVGDYVEYVTTNQSVLGDNYNYNFHSYFPMLYEEGRDFVQKLGQVDLTLNGKTVRCDKYSINNGEMITYVISGSSFRVMDEGTDDDGKKYCHKVISTDIDYKQGRSGVKVGNYADIEETIDGVLTLHQHYVVSSFNGEIPVCTYTRTSYNEIERYQVTSIGDDNTVTFDIPESYFVKLYQDEFIQLISYPDLQKLMDQLMERVKERDDMSINHTEDGTFVMNTVFGERKVTVHSYIRTGSFVNSVSKYYVGEDGIIYGGYYEQSGDQASTMNVIYELKSTNMLI